MARISSLLLAKSLFFFISLKSPFNPIEAKGRLYSLCIRPGLGAITYNFSPSSIIAKDAEMSVGDMKDTIGGFKFLTAAETKKSMESGNLDAFLKGMDTPSGSVDTSFLPL